MLHRVAGRKLGRTKNERTALFRNLANSLILHEKVVTTEAKAKSVRPMIEKLITRAKSNSIHNRRVLLKELVSENTVAKMLEIIGPKFKERPGGYTRMVKLGTRNGDKASMVSLMFVDEVSSPSIDLKKEVTEENIEKEKDTRKPKTKKTTRINKKEEKNGKED